MTYEKDWEFNSEDDLLRAIDSMFYVASFLYHCDVGDRGSLQTINDQGLTSVEHEILNLILKDAGTNIASLAFALANLASFFLAFNLSGEKLIQKLRKDKSLWSKYLACNWVSKEEA